LNHYQIKLNLHKSFIESTHNHPILSRRNSNYGDWYSIALKNSPNVLEIPWGGLDGCQFASLEEIEDFLAAFKELLKRKKISHEHQNNLLYFVNVFEDKAEEESLDNNEYNRTLEISRMLIDLMNIKLSELKPEDERLLYNPKTNVNYLITDQILESISKDQYPSELFKSMPVQVIVDDRYSHTKNLPHDLAITFKSKSIKYNTKRKPIQEIVVPASHVQAITELIIKYTLEEARKLDAPIYKAFKEQRADKDTLKAIYESRRILQPSRNEAIVRVGTLVRDYLKDNTALTTWYQQANFLFEYFALFKVYRPKKKLPDFPTSYAELVKYYKMCNVSYKSIETMFKDSNLT
jgi:hypothetical protein